MAMTPLEILTVFQSSRALFDWALREYQIVSSLGQIDEDMKTLILHEAQVSDMEVDDIVRRARERAEIEE